VVKLDVRKTNRRIVAERIFVMDIFRVILAPTTGFDHDGTIGGGLSLGKGLWWNSPFAIG
jgi:hypothetical protein